jgi:tetratricopeptide (TPR) repeat protein
VKQNTDNLKAGTRTFSMSALPQQATGGWVRGIAMRVAIPVLVLALASSGCAARRAGFSSRFIKPGQPTASFDEPVQGPPPHLQQYMQDVRKLQAKAAPKSSLLPTLETTDSTLAKALLLVAMQDTAANHRAVSAAYRDAGVLDYAFRHLKRAAALNRCDAAAYDGMARLWRAWGRPEIAIGDAYRAIQCNPGSAEIYNTLGTVMQQLGQNENARRAYQRAVALDSHATFALNNLCYLEVSEGHGAEAEGFCKLALAESPTFEPARNNLALAYIVGNDVATAEQQLLSGDRTADRWYNVGMLRLATGRYREAAEAFDQASLANPSLRIATRRAVQARRAALNPEQVDEYR